MKKFCSLFILAGIATLSVYSQTLYVPLGTGGIGTSSNANVGIGISTPGIWFGGASVLELYASRPVLKLNNTGGISTITFTNPAINSTSHTGEFHLNYYFKSANNNQSQLIFNGYPKQNILTLRADGYVGINTASPTSALTVNGDVGILNGGLNIN